MIYKLWCLLVAWSFFVRSFTSSVVVFVHCSQPVDALSFLPLSLLGFTRRGRVGSNAVLFAVQPLSFVLTSVRPAFEVLTVKIWRASQLEVSLSDLAIKKCAYQWKVPMPSFLSSTYSPLYFLPSGHSKMPWPSILLFFHSPLYWRPSLQLYTPYERIKLLELRSSECHIIKKWRWRELRRLNFEYTWSEFIDSELHLPCPSMLFSTKFPV